MKAEDYDLMMSHNNRAWLNDEEWDDSCAWTYKHSEYLGGEVSFDVNVSEVGCNCAFGVHLAYLNDEECRLDAYQPNELNPACDTIALMESNKRGFISSTQECAGGACTDADQCMAGLWSHTGYGENKTIDTRESYNVKIQFFVDQDATTLDYTGLTEIRTTLTQGDNTLTFNQESEGDNCQGIYDSLYLRLLNDEMALAFSSYNVGSHSDLDVACLGECSASTSKLTNLTWKVGTSVNPLPEPDNDEDPGKEIVTEKASDFIWECEDQKNDEGHDCTECKKAYYENTPEVTHGKCTNWVQYRYGNQCKSSQDTSRCSPGEMEYCFKAYPAASSKRWNDPDNKCRTVTEFVRNIDRDAWTWASRNHRRTDRGLCKVYKDWGLMDGMGCRLSWLKTDKSNSKASRGYSSILRPY